jgi:hypothetical protein
VTDVDDDFEADWDMDPRGEPDEDDDYGDPVGPDDPDDDRWQEYKDDVAMGYINRDGTQREPDEPDLWRQAYEQHVNDEHGGGPCTCPPPAPLPNEAEPPF